MRGFWVALVSGMLLPAASRSAACTMWHAPRAASCVPRAQRPVIGTLRFATNVAMLTGRHVRILGCTRLWHAPSCSQQAAQI